jgi:hypothetical protein
MQPAEYHDLQKAVTDYVYSHYAYCISGGAIKHGQTVFGVDMLISASVDTCKHNSEHEVAYVVDAVFNNFCS